MWMPAFAGMTIALLIRPDVIPAQAGIQMLPCDALWMPAFAGMTMDFIDQNSNMTPICALWE
jgi:hypothetical protein